MKTAGKDKDKTTTATSLRNGRRSARRPSTWLPPGECLSPHVSRQINARANAWDKLPGKQRAFLAAYVASFGNLSRAAAAANRDRTIHYEWLEQPEYAAAFVVAQEDAADLQKAEAARRAFVGCTRPIYQGGKLVGYEQVYSDRLAEMLMGATRPDLYRQRIEHSGRIDSQLSMRDEAERLRKLSPEDRAALRVLVTKMETAALEETVVKPRELGPAPQQEETP